jgi:hypothetical protein
MLTFAFGPSRVTEGKKGRQWVSVAGYYQLLPPRAVHVTHFPAFARLYDDLSLV